MRVLVVDDSSFMRKAIARMIESEPGLQVVAQACDGREGVECVKKHKPDVVTLDIEMPNLDGLSALREIVALPDRPAVLMCSSLTTEGSRAALDALRFGASDFIAKDASHFSVKIDSIRDELIEKIKAIGAGRVRRSMRPAAAASPGRVGATPSNASALRISEADLIAIGSSTGGPPVLERILTALPATGPAVVVAQHMPALFTRSMAERLATVCKMPVHHAEHRAMVIQGHVYIGEGGKHVRVMRGPGGKACLEVSEQPVAAPYKPSVNELLASVASMFGPRAVGVVLTGMGDDGMIGAQAMRRAGAHVLAQDAESSVVYGMPRAVAECGAASASLPPDQIAAVLARLTPPRNVGGVGASAA